MRIALIVDNPYRDLLGLVLLAWELARRGATCYLVPHNFEVEELSALAPDFVLLNFLRRTNEGFVARLLDAGVQVGVLDTEGQDGLDRVESGLARSEAVRSRIACFCSWGEKVAAHAVRAGWFGREQVAVTGAPRMDFYVAPWREAALAASSYADAYGRPMVLVNGSFPLGNPARRRPDQDLEALINQVPEGTSFVKVNGYAPETVLAWQRDHYQGMRQLAALVNDLAARFPHVTFVYRPHPFEKLETYDDLLDRRDNLHLTRQGAVNGWLLRSAAVIQRSCSTGLEAGLAGIPSLAPAWLPISTGIEEADALSIPCPTPDAVAEGIEAALRGTLATPPDVADALEQVTRDLFYQMDGLAHRRVADAILRGMTRRAGEGPRLGRLRTLHYGQRSEGGMSVSGAVKRLLGLPMLWSFRHWRRLGRTGWAASYKHFDLQQVHEMLAAVSACGGEGDGVAGQAVARNAGARDYRFRYAGHSIVIAPAEPVASAEPRRRAPEAVGR